MPTALHSTSSPSDVLLAQIRAVGLLLRGPAAAIGAVAGFATTAITGELLDTGRAISFHPEHLMLPAVVGILLPIGVWMGEERFGGGFLWTLPVDRRQHALTRVCAGWVWLMLAALLFVLWLLALTLLSGGNILGEETRRLIPMSSSPGLGTLRPGDWRIVQWRPEPVLWLVPFTAATGTYLLASALMLGVRHPLRWIVAVLLGFALLLAVSDAANAEGLLRDRLLRPILFGPYGLDTLLTARTNFLRVGTTLSTGEAMVVWRGMPDLAQWATATLLWTLAALLALWAAASRHRECRRA